ncbi:MAG: DinB family protein [Candidatus Azobacteroides sp.]|nr:DinB family protein [Candidatus Azobacteroides sp.]
MSKIEFLKQQIIESRNFVNRLVSELPEALWYTIPEGTDSNFAWQIGHLIVAQNFHTLTVISGVNEKVCREIPLKEYNKIFNGMGTLHRSVEKDLVPVRQLRNQLNMVHAICLENLEKLTEETLMQKLEPIPFRHPVATIKYEALSWSFKHEMWHCAEMEEIKRMLGYPIRWLD